MQAAQRNEREVFSSSQTLHSSTLSTPESAISERTASSSISNPRLLARGLSGLEAPNVPKNVQKEHRSHLDHVPTRLESESSTESDSEEEVEEVVVEEEEDSESSSDESSEAEEEEVDSQSGDPMEAEGGQTDSQSESNAEDEQSSSEEGSDGEPDIVTTTRISRRISSVIHYSDDSLDLIIEEIDSETIEFDNLPVLLPFQFEEVESCASQDDLNSESSDDDGSSSESSDDDISKPNGRDPDLDRAQKEFEKLQIRKRRIRRRRWKLGADHKRKHDQAVGSDLDIEDVVPLLEDDQIPHPQLPITMQTSNLSSGLQSGSGHQRHPSNSSPTATRRIRRRTEGPEERERPRTSVLYNDVSIEIAVIRTEEQEVVIADGDADDEEIIFPPWFHRSTQATNMELDDE